MDASGTVQFMDVPPNDSRYGTVLQIIRNSFLDPHYQPSWVIHSLQTVKNLKLFQNYKAKSEELKLSGRDITEYDMFTCYKTVDLIRNILEHGLQTRHSSFNFLGNSQKGVNLCRHADIQLKAADNTGQEECYLIIYKVMLGKALPVYPSPDNQQLAPTENFDSHISSLSVDRTIPLGQQAIRSQVFCYEYINGQLSSCPRHVLPYVVVCYKRPSHAVTIPPSMSLPFHTQRPNIQPPPPPLVQMAPAPQASSIHGLYQPQPSSDTAKVPNFQPRLPPRNPFRTQNFPIATRPLPPYQTETRMQYPGASACQTMQTINLSSSSMMVPVVPPSVHVPTTGMRLPYVSLPPHLDASNHLVLSQANQSSYPPRVPLTSLPQMSAQNFSMFHSSTRVPTPHAGMSIPLQLPTSESADANTQTALSKREKKEMTGMRLPIIIQPDESSAEEAPQLTEQSAAHQQAVHRHLPALVTTEPSAQSHITSSAEESTRPVSPLDIKPDISKLLLKSKRKPSCSENVQTVEELGSKMSQDKPLVGVTVATAERGPSLLDTTDLTALSNNQNSLNIIDEPAVRQVSQPSSHSGQAISEDSGSNLSSTQSVTRSKQVNQVGDVLPVQNNEINKKRVTEPNRDVHVSVVNSKQITVQDVLHNGDRNAQKDTRCTIIKKLNLAESSCAEAELLEEDETLPDLVENGYGKHDYPVCKKLHELKDVATKSSKSAGYGHCKMRKRKPLSLGVWLRKRRQNALNTRMLKIRKLLCKKTFGSSLSACYPLLQENSAFHFTCNGSIKMFYDLHAHSKGGIGRVKITKVTEKQPVHLLFDKALSECDINFVLRNIGVKYEVEVMDKDLYDGNLTEHGLPESACSGGTASEQHRIPLSQEDADIDVETIRTEEHSGTVDQINEMQDVWETAITNERLQPKVVVKDIRSTSDWDTLIRSETEKDTCAEETGSLCLQISRVESIVNSVSQEGGASDEGSAESKVEGGQRDTEIHVFPEPVVTCRASVHLEQQKELAEMSEPIILPDSTQECKSSAGQKAGNELDGSDSVEAVEDKTKADSDKKYKPMEKDCETTNKNEGSISNSPKKDLEHTEQENPFSPSSSNSSFIDVAQLESWGTRLSLPKDLNKDESKEKSSNVLDKLSQIRQELSKGTGSSANTLQKSTLDLFLDNEDTHEVHRVEKPDAEIGRNSSEFKQCRRQKRPKKYKRSSDGFKPKASCRPRDVTRIHSVNSYLRKYSHFPYKQRQSGYSRHLGCLHGRNRKVCYRAPRKKHPFSRQSSLLSNGFCDSQMSSSSLKRDSMPVNSNDSFDNDLKGERSRSDSEETSPISEKPGSETKSDNRTCSAEKVTTEYKLANKEATVRDSCEVNVSLEEEEGREKIVGDNTERTSEQKERTGEVIVTGKLLRSNLPSSGGLLKTRTQTDQRKAEKEETNNVNEKWAETCERLFLGRSSKEGSPLFDGYSASSESSALADPGEWLNKLIRINSKRAVIPTKTQQQQQSVKHDRVSDNAGDQSKLLSVAAVQSTEKTGASWPKEVVPDNRTREKSDVNMSREELTDLVSRALTILKPSEGVVVAAETRQAHTEHANDVSNQNRLYATYVHRKRKSSPAVGVQDNCETSTPPKLWGAQSLEEMHQNVAYKEAVVSSLPKYQVNTSLGPAVTNTSHEAESQLTPAFEAVPLRSPNCQVVGGSGSSVEVSAQSRDPRLRRLSLSPRAESGSDVENVFHSPVASTGSPVRESPSFTAVDVENKTNKPKNRVSRLWEASISAPKALGNESVALRELKTKDKRPEHGHVRRLSSSDRSERKLSVDEKFINYLPWKRELQTLDLPDCVRYQNIESRPDSKDPRLNKKRGVHDCELAKRATKHCRSIPLERLGRDQTAQNIKHTNSELKELNNVALKDTKRRDDENQHNTDRIAQSNDDGEEYLPCAESQRSLPDSNLNGDCSAEKRPLSRTSKALVSRSSFLTPAKTPVDDIGVSCTAARSAMEEVWQLGAEEYQSLNDEMTYILNKRIQNIEDSLVFSDPTKGLDQQRRLKLIASGNVSDAVKKELQIEEEMKAIKEKNHLARQQLEDVMKSRSLPESAVKELKFQIDIRDIKYEKYNKELEDLGRFSKSSVVEVLPDVFRLDDEKNKFISAEGSMLFLVSPLKEVDCKRLLALKEEIRERRNDVENPSTAYGDQRLTKLRLGWLHNERKEALCQLCLNMNRTKQVLLQRFLYKLSWCSKAESVLQLYPEKDDLLNYIKNRYQRLERYIGVLKSVQRLDNGIWAVKTSKSYDEPFDNYRAVDIPSLKSKMQTDHFMKYERDVSATSLDTDQVERGTSLIRLKCIDDCESSKSVEVAQQEASIRQQSSKLHSENVGKIGHTSKGNEIADQEISEKKAGNERNFETNLSSETCSNVLSNGNTETSNNMPMADAHMSSEHHAEYGSRDDGDCRSRPNRTRAFCGSEKFAVGADDETKTIGRDDTGSGENAGENDRQTTGKRKANRTHCRKRRKRHRRRWRSDPGAIFNKSLLSASTLVAKAKMFRRSAGAAEHSRDAKQYSGGRFGESASSFALSVDVDVEQGEHRHSDDGRNAFIDTGYRVVEARERRQNSDESDFDHGRLQNYSFASRSPVRTRPFCVRRSGMRTSRQSPDVCHYHYQHHATLQRLAHNSSPHGSRGRRKPSAYYHRSNIVSRFQ